MQCNANNNVDEVKFRCSYVNCLNERKLYATKIKEHLLCDEFLQNYTTWIWHDELLPLTSMYKSQEYVDSTMDDGAKENWLDIMIHDVGLSLLLKCKDTKVCLAMQRLSCILDQLISHGHWQCQDWWIWKQLMDALIWASQNCLFCWRKCFQRKILYLIVIMKLKRLYVWWVWSIKKIHACPNDCILYKKDFELLKKCPRCGFTSWKTKMEIIFKRRQRMDLCEGCVVSSYHSNDKEFVYKSKWC